MIACFFFGYAGAASAYARGGTSSVWVFVFSVGAEIDGYFFNCYCDVLYVRIRFTYFFAISVLNHVRIFCFAYGLNLR